MEYEDTQDNPAGSGFTMFGAIFMCNRATKKECLKRKLFGLPPSASGFVRKVKAGMVLFLFENEERKLYGVYQASSDGALNIVPNAFRSAGLQVPAQVLFKTIWNCDPLSEHEFHDAIRDNYYTQRKFHFGLDEDQVSKLLWLFNSRRVKIQKPQYLSRDKVKNQSRNSYVNRVRTNQEDRYIRTDTFESKYSTDNELINPSKDSELRRSSLSLTFAADKHFLELNNSLVEAPHRLPLAALPSDEPQLHRPYLALKDDMSDECADPAHNLYFSSTSSVLFGSPTFDANDSSLSPLVTYSKSSTDPLFSFSRDQQMSSSVGPTTLNMSTSGKKSLSGMKSLKENLFSPSRGWHPTMTPLCSDSKSFSMSQTRYGILDVTSSFGDYIPLNSCDNLGLSYATIPSTEFTDFRSHRLDNYERCKGLSVPESSVTESPLSMLEDFRPEVMRMPVGADVLSSKSPSHLHGDNRNELLNYDFATASISSIDAEQLRSSHVAVDSLDPQTVDFRKKGGHERRNNFANDDHGHEGLFSPYYGDVRKKRLSVFSRLSMKQEATEQNEDEGDGDGDGDGDFYGCEDTSPAEIMGFLQQKESYWRKSSKNYKQNKWWLKDADSLQVTQEEMSLDNVVVIDDEIHIERTETPFINFKRRSKSRYKQDEKREETSDTAPKRRKLLRPSFATILEPASDGEKKSDETFGLSPKRTKLLQPHLDCIGTPSRDKDVVGEACHMLHEPSKEIFQAQENPGNKVSKDEGEGDKKDSPNTSLLDTSFPVDCNTRESDKKGSSNISFLGSVLPVDCQNDAAKGLTDLGSEDYKVEKKVLQDGIPPSDCSLDHNGPVHESFKIKHGLITKEIGAEPGAQVLGVIKDSYLKVLDSSEDKVVECNNSKAAESLGNTHRLPHLPLKTERNANDIEHEVEKKEVFPLSLSAGLSLDVLKSSESETVCDHERNKPGKESGIALQGLADMSSRKSVENEKASSSHQDLSSSCTNYTANKKERKGLEVGKSGAIGIDLNLIPEN